MASYKDLTPEQRKEIQAKIKVHTDAAYASIAEACKIADEYGASFSFDVAYGMGGSYQGGPDDGKEDWEDDREIGWFPSSQGC